jgi:hypothetical protein
VTFFNQHQLVLWIAQGRIEAMNQGFRSQHAGDSSASIIMIAAVVFALGLTAGILLYLKRTSQKIVDDPLQLFRELSRAHGLNWSQRRLLLQFATSRGLQDPCALFLEADHFSLDPTVDAQLSQPKLLKRFMIVRRTIFDPEKQPVATA